MAANAPAYLAVPPPESEELSIWRYMDFARFVALLENASLFFVRVSLLGDPFEGSFPATQPPLARLLELLPAGAIPAGAQVNLSPGLDSIWGNLREWVVVSCWHASTHESDAMWRLYSKANAAVAIRSTVGRLRAALGERPPFQEGFGGADRFHIGMVQYIDYERDRIPVTSFAAQFFRKRKGFEHEQELRAVLIDFPITKERAVDYARKPDYEGRKIHVALETLIQEVVIAPSAPSWYPELIQSLLHRYGLKVVCRRSALAARPQY